MNTSFVLVDKNEAIEICKEGLVFVEEGRKRVREQQIKEKMETKWYWSFRKSIEVATREIDSPDSFDAGWNNWRCYNWSLEGKFDKILAASKITSYKDIFLSLEDAEFLNKWKTSQLEWTRINVAGLFGSKREL